MPPTLRSVSLCGCWHRCVCRTRLLCRPRTGSSGCCLWGHDGGLWHPARSCNQRSSRPLVKNKEIEWEDEWREVKDLRRECHPVGQTTNFSCTSLNYSNQFTRDPDFVHKMEKNVPQCCKSDAVLCRFQNVLEEDFTTQENLSFQTMCN